MKKLAIFCEGQTEILIAEAIVLHLAKDKKISFERQKADGGRKQARQFIIELKSPTPDAEYFILLVNSGTDTKVKSDILERKSSLLAAGFCKILAIRDVYPLKTHEIPALRKGLAIGVPGELNVDFILGVMEVEAWILAEINHYERIHPNLNLKRIKKELNIDLLTEDLSARENPAFDLKNIYWLEYISYDKSKAIIERILEAIQHENLQENVSAKFIDLLKFYEEVNLFLN